MKYSPTKIAGGVFLLLFAGILMTMLPELSFATGSSASAEMKKAGADGEGLYSVVPQRMAAAECARCHPYQFNQLRDFGGGHRFDCQDCHDVFHAFNPRKDNFPELMPKCSNCHDLIHGKETTECLLCHENPHAPTSAVAQEKVSGRCRFCHGGPSEELEKFPSAHTSQGCEGCHNDKHGFIPPCLDCHEVHYADQKISDCRGCHPAHRPTEMRFESDSEPRNCRACHSDVYTRWTGTPSRHGQVNCTACHNRHGHIPECSNCHTSAHDPAMMARFSKCLECHMDVHDLPVK
jgi:hypothetical protein